MAANSRSYSGHPTFTRTRSRASAQPCVISTACPEHHRGLRPFQSRGSQQVFARATQRLVQRFKSSSSPALCFQCPVAEFVDAPDFDSGNCRCKSGRGGFTRIAKVGTRNKPELTQRAPACAEESPKLFVSGAAPELCASFRSMDIAHERLPPNQ
jgi:hypothetical protein